MRGEGNGSAPLARGEEWVSPEPPESRHAAPPRSACRGRPWTGLSETAPAVSGRAAGRGQLRAAWSGRAGALGSDRQHLVQPETGSSLCDTVLRFSSGSPPLGWTRRIPDNLFFPVK
ncbi:hypothetical protein NDU88_001436 [Pleurodeles waltl]|uniref:Uncharacterized protein n=1 Tax=Pleurodeles waltl TaxID=8319 RepID=A0AAV7W013_PLEWA|nr:hypothetical protein NDU88_001436 [Pleurodeles waltl]